MSIVLIKRSGQNSPLTDAQYDATMVTIETALNAIPASSGGTVTSVALTGVSGIITVSGSPISTSGTFALSLNTQTANRIFAGPTTGSAAAPTFRAMVVADLPTVTVAKGGTGLTATGTAYQLLRTNSGATALEYATIVNGSSKVSVTNGVTISIDIVPANIAVSDLTGTLQVAHGGTGGTTAQTARISLLPAIAGNALKVLRVNAGETDYELATPTSAVSSVNSLTGALTIVAGSAGTDYAIASVGTTITINIPSASAANRGLITIGAQVIAGVKTITSNPIIDASTVANVFFSSAIKELVGSTDFTFTTATKAVRSGMFTSFVTDDIVANTTLTYSQRFINCIQAGAIDITMPIINIIYLGHQFIILDSQGTASGNPITVKSNGGEVFQNAVAGSYTMDTDLQCITVELIYQGGSYQWAIISKFKTT